MAKKAKKLHTKKGVSLEIVNPDAAGIDIADSEMQVCVPSDRDEETNRRYGSFTRDLNDICDWLHKCRIVTVAMEATGIYWIPLFLKLQDSGFDVVLVNAREIKNISEKKTDESDAEWIMLLHQYGLLKASFQPDRSARQVRNLARHRSNLLRTCAKEVQHMQKAMEMMNIKLTNVLSDITGLSGMRMIDAILGGNHDPKALSLLADGRCRHSREEIRLSLEGTWDEDHLFELKQSRELYAYIQEQVKTCDEKIAELLHGYVASVPEKASELVRSKKHVCKKNKVGIDVEMYANSLWGVNLMDIPGMSVNSLLGLISELGYDFVDKFDTAEKFCKWCNLVPNNKISGGKLLSSRVPKRKNPVGQILRQCANTVRNEKTEMGAYFRRLKSRGGHMQAIVATAHKIARIIYTMVKNKTPYDAGKVGISEAELLKKKIEKAQNALASLNVKYEALVS